MGKHITATKGNKELLIMEKMPSTNLSNEQIISRAMKVGESIGDKLFPGRKGKELGKATGAVVGGTIVICKEISNQ